MTDLTEFEGVTNSSVITVVLKTASSLLVALNFHLLSREHLLAVSFGKCPNAAFPASAFESPPGPPPTSPPGPWCLHDGLCRQRPSLAAKVTSKLPRLSLRAGASLLFLTKHFQSTLGFLHGWLNCLCLFRTLLLFLCPAADLSVSSLWRRKLTGQSIWPLASSSGKDLVLVNV